MPLRVQLSDWLAIARLRKGCYEVNQRQLPPHACTRAPNIDEPLQWNGCIAFKGSDQLTKR